MIQFDGLDFDNDHGVTVGVNYRFQRPTDSFWNKALNGLNVMGEYYDGVWNVGANYSVWKDRINVMPFCMTDDIGREGCISKSV